MSRLQRTRSGFRGAHAQRLTALTKAFLNLESAITAPHASPHPFDKCLGRTCSLAIALGFTPTIWGQEEQIKNTKRGEILTRVRQCNPAGNPVQLRHSASTRNTASKYASNSGRDMACRSRAGG